MGQMNNGCVCCGFGQCHMVNWFSCSLRGVEIAPFGPEKWLVSFRSLLPTLLAAAVVTTHLDSTVANTDRLLLWAL